MVIKNIRLGSKENPIKITKSEELDNLQQNKIGTWFKYRCVDCNKEILVNFRKQRVPKYKTMMCGICRANTPEMLKHRGEQISKALAKMDPERRKEIAEKVSKSRLNMDPIKMANAVSKAKQKKKDKYNDENYNNREQAKLTCLNKYGYTTYSQTNEFKKFSSEHQQNRSKEEWDNINSKTNSTNLIRYGCKRPMQNKSIQEKVKNKNMNKFGYSTNLIVPDKIERNMYTKLQKYGSVNCNYLYFYNNQRFTNSWELAVWLYCNNLNIPISTCNKNFEYYDKNGKRHLYFPDYIINGKYVEIKGSQFWNNDFTKMISPFKYNSHGEKLNNEEIEFNNDLYERKHQCGLTNGVEFWKQDKIDFIINYCDIRFPYWKFIYNKNNLFNPCYNSGYYFPVYATTEYNTNKGITPYDYDNKKQYIIRGKGLTPFDIY